MDMQMPEMGGIEATQLIRSLEKNDQHIPIIAMTANAMPGDRERCIDAGMDYYLSKPIKSDSLKDLLNLVAANRSLSNANLEHASVTPNKATGSTQDLFNHQFDFALALVDADEEILQIITPMFIEGCDKQVDEIRVAIASSDTELLHRSAHTFKGLVGNFNAKPIEQLAKAIELKAKALDLSEVESLFAEMLTFIDPLKAALKKYLEKNAGSV